MEGKDEEAEEEIELCSAIMTLRELKVSSKMHLATWPFKSPMEGLMPSRGRLPSEDPLGGRASGW